MKDLEDLGNARMKARDELLSLVCEDAAAMREGRAILHREMVAQLRYEMELLEAAANAIRREEQDA
jgi:hypothetical protein